MKILKLLKILKNNNLTNTKINEKKIKKYNVMIKKYLKELSKNIYILENNFSTGFSKILF